jgi:RND superfamily putative drug exporter
MKSVHTGALARLARACALHPQRTIAVWVALLAVAIGSSAAFGGPLVNEFTIPGSETQHATDLLKERFPANAGDSATVVFTAPHGFRSEQARSAVADAEKAAGHVGHVVAVGDPYSARGGGISRDERIAYLDVRFDKQAFEVDQADVDDLKEVVRKAVEPSLRVEFGGDVVNAAAPESGSSEVIGLAAAIIVLLLVLGTAVAMSLPIVLALVSVGIGVSLLGLAATVTNLNTVTPILAVMLGLGVGIDYALFIVTRFRQALAGGLEPVEAAVEAGATAGRAVVFAGTTVAISISGLAIIGLGFVTKLGLGAASTVVISVCAAVSLLPALLARLGHGVNRLRVPTFVAQSPRPRLTFVERWGRAVTRRPRTAVVVALAALVAMAIPVASLNLGSSDAGTNAKHTTEPEGVRPADRGVRPGAERVLEGRRRPEPRP